MKFISMSFSVLLDEMYDIYVFQYAPCLKFMIFMFFILLLDELYDIYVCQYVPE